MAVFQAREISLLQDIPMMLCGKSVLPLGNSAYRFPDPAPQEKIGKYGAERLNVSN